MATITMTMLAETQAMRRGIDDVNNRLGVMGKTVTSVGRMVKGLAVGFVAFKAVGAVTNSIKEASAAIALQDKLLAQTRATLKSTGGAAGVTAKEILGLSDALERKSLIDAEEIQAGQNMLLTFTNIRNEAGKGNDIFNQTTQIMTDLSTAMGQSTKSSALQLGKALNDPIKGVSALSRVGVSFTQQQKDQIETLVASGKTMQAQKVILAELSKEFGGSAAAAGDTFSGKVKHLKDVWDGFVESLVRKALPGLTRIVDFLAKNLPTAIAAGSKAFTRARAALAPYVAQFVAAAASLGKSLLPALKNLASFVVGSVIPAIGSLVDFLVKYQDVVVPVAAGIGAIVVALKTYQAVANAVKAVQAAWIVVQTALNTVMAMNPIGLIVLALIGLGVALVVAYKKSETFRNIVNGAFNAVKNVTMTVFNFIKKHIKTAMLVALVAVTGPIGLIVIAVVKNWNRIKSATQAVWNAIKAVVSGAIKFVTTVIRTEIAIAKAVISGAWNAVKAITQAAWKGFTAIISLQIDAVVRLASGLKNKVTGALSGAKTLLLDIGKQIIQGLIDGIQSGVSKVEGVLKGITDKIPDWKGPKQRDKKLLTPTGKWIIQSLVKGFEDGRGGIKNSLGDITKMIEKYFDKRFKNDKEAAKHSKAAIKGLADETKALMKNAKKREKVYAALEKAQKRLADIRKAAADYKSSVVSSVKDYASITNLDAAFNSNALLTELKHRLDKVKQFAALIKQLVSAGLNPTAVNQLVAAGVEGGLAYAQAIAAGGPDAIAQFNDLQNQINQAANGLGTTAAQDMYGAGIQAAEGLIKGLESQRKRLEQWARNLAKTLIKALKDELKINPGSAVDGHMIPF